MEKKFPFFKTLTLLVWLVLGMGTAFASNFWADHASQPTKDTTIDSKSFYVVSSAEELAWIALQTATDHPSNEKKVTLNFILKNDIDLAGKIWTPICPGGGNVHCNGIFDGAGHSIMNMTIVSDSIYSRYHAQYPNWTGNNDMGKKYVQNAGLVGTLGSGTIKNLSVTNVSFYITNGSSTNNQISVGPLVGWKDANGGVIDFCSASGTINTSGKTQGVGGLVGNAHSGTIKNSISYVNILASGDNAYVGGIVGLTKNNEVAIQSCVYAGETLISTGTGSSVGAVAGYVVSGAGVKPTNTYYDNGNTDIPAVGNKSVTGATDTDKLNSEKVVCVLNGGIWENEACTETENMSSYWSEGLSGLSLNGSDGYKIKFDANGGSFTSGAKTSKILADGETITADEIATPTLVGKKFAGWATKADTTEPSSNLGIADAQKKIYAVWYDFYTVTFKDTPENANAFGNVQVAKNGMVTVDGFTVPSTKSVGNATYYFTGWAFEPKMFDDENYELKKNDTLHLADLKITQDIVLYAVWTKAKTFSVTFNATLHGKTEVTFVRILTEGEIVPEPGPNDVVTEPGYKIIGWYTDANCTASNKYGFDAPLGGNLTLYAKWEVVEYHINYVLNDGTNDKDNPSTYTINSDDIVLANPTNAGASFDGWFYDAQFNNRATQISKGSSGDKTLYAKWTPHKYTIHYLSGSTVAGTTPTDEKEYNKPIQLKGAVDEFAHKGCEQDGWSLVDLGDKVYGLGATYEGNEDLMLYPHWVCNTYTITYEIFGASATNRNPAQYTGPAKLTLENAFDPANKYFMDSWYKERDFKNTIRDVQNIDANLTVYARWYNKIIYNPGSRLKAVNSNLGSTTDKKYWNKDYTIKSSIKDFVLEKYTLDGWSLSDGGEKAYNLNVTYTANENLTLYPHWVEKCDSVQYGAVKIYTYATDGRKEAVINGDYSHKNKPNEQRDAVAIPNDIVVNNVVMSRKFPVNVYSTIVLPFSVNTENVEGLSAVLYYNGIKKENGKSSIRMKVLWAEDNLIMGKNGQYVHYNHTNMLANTPYLLLMNDPTFAIKSKAYPITLERTTSAEEDANGSGWTFRGTWKYKEWGPKQEDSPENYDSETGYAYGFSAAASGDKINVGDFVRVGEGAWIRPMRAYLVRDDKKAQLARANGAYVNRPSVVQEELPEIMSIVIDNGRDDEGQTTVIGHFNTRTGEIKMIPQNRTFDIKGRNVGNKANKARGAYYGKKVLKK